ncbi:MAG: DUF4838 domain-containing protein [Clostridia bacterium]|nr:DUF4838 domain-containing protein [Clostridia bacterium]
MKAPNTVTIARLGSHKTVIMAASELKKYLNLMDPLALVDVRIYDKFDASIPNLLWVGIDDELDKNLKPVEDKSLDDAICIEVTDFCGFITGANERAVLIAVYRFLKELGVRWLCPGKIGEVIPEKILDKCQIHINEVPSMRHRTICIEGAIGYEHTYDLIDWMTKMGMNGYLFQFFVPDFFFRRWYLHERNNEVMEPIPFTREDGLCIHKKLIEDVTDRSLIHHAVGHGWTAEPFGLDASGWDYVDDDTVPGDIREMLAMTNGKRQLFGGAPSNTQACYSNPKAIEKIAKSVADHCESHPDIDYIHVWLADMRNNFCECENCRDIRPTDLYIKMLNRVDEELTSRNIDTKIVMISYNDVSWAPQFEKLNNPDRFSLMFAPITRRFDSSYADVDLDNLPEEEWPFELNRLVMPRENTPVVRLMKGWDNFKVYDRSVFDYHFWSTTFISDIGGFKIADVMSRDIKTYKKLGLDGLISCQVQRCSFPTNVPMQVMADTLWNENVSFDTVVDDYLRDAFGKEYKTVRNYLETLSKLTAYWVKNEEPDVIVNDELREKNEKGIEIIKEHREVFAKILEDSDFENDVQKMFWKILIKHLDLAEVTLKLQVRKFSGESPEERLDATDAVANAYREAEPELHRFIDVWRQLLTLGFATPIEDAH